MWRRIVLLLAITGVHALNGKCRVLALGGGTERGAYEAGVVIGLVNNLPAGEAQWDVVTGVGVGALNALIIGSYAQGQESQAATKLQQFWTSFTYGQVYTDWPGGFVTGWVEESGLYDGAPLKKTVTTLSPTKFQRWVGVGATDLISGSYVFFNSSSQTVANMRSGIEASMTDPGILPIIAFNKLQLVSGSIKFAIDILDAVNACNQLGYANANIIVTAVMGAGRTIKQVDAINYRTLQVTYRFFEIAAYDSLMKIIENAGHDFPQVSIPYVIFPSQDLNRTLYPYDFTPQDLAAQLALGQKDAKTAVTTALITE